MVLTKNQYSKTFADELTVLETLFPNTVSHVIWRHAKPAFRKVVVTIHQDGKSRKKTIRCFGFEEEVANVCRQFVKNACYGVRVVARVTGVTAYRGYSYSRKPQRPCEKREAYAEVKTFMADLERITEPQGDLPNRLWR